MLARLEARGRDVALWAAVATGAWALLVVGRGGASPGLLTGGWALMAPMTSPAMPDMAMGRAGASMSMLGIPVPAGSGLVSWRVLAGFEWMWLVMVAAMMVVVLLPAIVMSRRVAEPLDARTVAISLVPWALLGLPVYGLLVALQEILPAPGTATLRAGADLVLVLALYELTACKQRWRQRCCVVTSPARAVPAGPAPAGSWRAGLRQGVAGIGCCGPTMVALALIGMMDLGWMVALTAVMVAERIAPWGSAVSRAAGVALIVVSAAMLIAPYHLPSLA